MPELPEVEKVDLFINTIKDCIKFIKEGQRIETNESQVGSLHTHIVSD